MVDIQMTDEQREEFKEHALDAHAMGKTLEVAMIVHSNAMNLLRKREQASWSKAAATHGLKLEDGWFADTLRGVFTQENRT